MNYDISDIAKFLSDGIAAEVSPKFTSTLLANARNSHVDETLLISTSEMVAKVLKGFEAEDMIISFKIWAGLEKRVPKAKPEKPKRRVPNTTEAPPRL